MTAAILLALLALRCPAKAAQEPPAQEPKGQEPKAGEGAQPPAVDSSALQRALDSVLDPELLELFHLTEPMLTGAAAPQSPDLATAPETVAGGNDFIGAPIPFRNPSLGAGLGGVFGYVFRTDPSDTVTQPSFAGVGGFYSENESWAAGAAVKLYLDQDRYRALGAFAYGDVNYDFFGIGNNAGDMNRSVPINQVVSGVVGELLTRVAPHTYLGGRGLFGNTRVSLDAAGASGPIGQGLSQQELDAMLAALGARFQRDTRDEAFYPRQGTLLDFQGDVYDELWGSDFEYQTAAAAYNRYLTLSERQVLALRGYGRVTFGDVPFFGLSMLGVGSDGRGYTAGRYRDRMLLSAQAEYRLEVAGRFGAVAFGGLGEVAPELDEFDVEHILPSVGFGLRFRLSSEHHINFRLDFAYGEDSDAIYFGIGEAF